MAALITQSLHELVAEMHAYADTWLRAQYGVSFKVFEFLAVLTDEPSHDITRLAECLGVTKAAVSKRVPRLVSEGWITATPGHGRQIKLHPTEKGAILAERARAELERRFREFLNEPRLDPAQNPDAISPERFHGHIEALHEVLKEKRAAL